MPHMHAPVLARFWGMTTGTVKDMKQMDSKRVLDCWACIMLGAFVCVCVCACLHMCACVRVCVSTHTHLPLHEHVEARN